MAISSTASADTSRVKRFVREASGLKVSSGLGPIKREEAKGQQLVRRMFTDSFDAGTRAKLVGQVEKAEQRLHKLEHGARKLQNLKQHPKISLADAKAQYQQVKTVAEALRSSWNSLPKDVRDRRYLELNRQFEDVEARVRWNGSGEPKGLSDRHASTQKKGTLEVLELSARDVLFDLQRRYFEQDHR